MPESTIRRGPCAHGKALLYEFCRENGVGHARISKLLVATADQQLPKLKALAETARNNGCEDLEPLTAEQARALEPEVRCVAALLSPSTGIVDSHGLMSALDGHITTAGGQVVLNSAVQAITRQSVGLYALTLADGNVITCQNLVLAAGLHVSKLARTLSYGERYQVPETYYAKGQYYALSGVSPFKRHIYPMPDGAWLGLHATLDLGGRCKFGPDIAWTPEIDYSFQPEKIEQFLDFIRSYYPGLDATRLHADYTGVRPKLYREGEPVPDFRIDGVSEHGLENLVVLAGIESPGLTASLAIAEVVAAMVQH
jgi:L-2-hydroxyglutarate oxidase LhgO